MKEVKIKMVVDSSSAVKNVDNLNDALDETTKSQKDVKKATSQTTEAQDKAKKSTQKNQAAFEGMNKATGGALRGVRALIKQMWLLVANPIGLVVAAIALALTSLYKAFTSTKAGGEAFDQVMAGISATIDVVRDRVLVIGEALVKFFTGDFKGAMDAGKRAVSGFGEEVANEFRIAAEAKRDLQEVVDTMRELSVTRAELDRDLIKAKETIESSTASYEEKKKAIDEVRIAETKQTESELAAAKKKLDAIRAQNAQSDSGGEDLDKEAAALIAFINLEKVSSSNKTKFAKLEEMADRDEESRIKAIQAAKTNAAKQEEAEDKQKAADQKVKDDAEKARLKTLSDYEKELKKQNEDLDAINEEEKLELERERALAKLEVLKGTEDEKREALRLLNEFYDNKEDDLADKRSEEKNKRDADDAKKEIDTAKKVADAKKGIQDSTLNTISGGIALLKQLGNDSKALQAAALIGEAGVGIAKMIIGKNTADLADTAHAATLGPAGAGYLATKKILNKVNLGIGLASTTLATAKGLQALGQGGGVDAGSEDQGGGVSAPAPSFNLVEGSEGNQIQNSIQSAGDVPVRAFVVAQDVTSQQSLDRQIEQNAGV